MIEEHQKSGNAALPLQATDEDKNSCGRITVTWCTWRSAYEQSMHAIFFRLSDQTVQIVFYDHTEVLLTPDERYITYVDKNKNRSTYFMTDELVGCNAEIAKRLKYTKEILQQLVGGTPKR